MPIKDTSISYYSAPDQAFTFVGKEPVPEDACIPVHDIDMNTCRVTLRCRQGQQHMQQHLVPQAMPYMSSVLSQSG